MDDVKQIREIVSSIADPIIMASPGDDSRVLGHGAYVASFRQFAELAKVKTFVPATPRVEVIVTTAVAICPFEIEYEMEGETYREKGIDRLVLARPFEQWKIVWRTVTSKPQAVV